jgi:cell division protein FtsN
VAAKLSAIDRAIAAVGGKPAKTSPASVAVAPSSAAGSFVIQIGASSSRVEAERIAKRYASRGARVSAADVDGKRWYRVRLASYDSRPDAERALSRLSRETGLSGFVTAAR